MAKKINAKKWYTTPEAGPFLRLTAESVKKHCRGGSLKGKRGGAKKQWMISGTEIIKKRKEWELDGIER